MNSNLMQEIVKATAMVNAMETEVTAAAKELETSVAQSRRKKGKHIMRFVDTMRQMLVDAKYPQNQRLYIAMPWSVKELGEYTNHHWTIALRLASLTGEDARQYETMVFGRYYVGACDVSEDVLVDPVLDTMKYGDKTYSKEIYPMIVDGWNEQIEAMIETKVAEAVQKTLKDRMKAMTDRLNKATAEHQKYEGE